MTRVIFDKHLDEIRKILVGADRRRLAVAFWGRGAMSELGLDKGTTDTRIICDLMSGACCPDEIRALINRFGRQNVKSRDGLHSKIYLTPDAMSIGSSNASSNGLGFEGIETATNIETNVIINDILLVKGAETVFDKWWVASETISITDELLQKADVLYKLRRKRRHEKIKNPDKLPSVFELWEKSPASFNDVEIYVMGYPDDFQSKNSKKQFKQDKVSFSLPKGVESFENHNDDLSAFSRGRVFLDLADWHKKNFNPTFYQVVDYLNWKSPELHDENWFNVYIQEAIEVGLPTRPSIHKDELPKINDLLPSKDFRKKYSVFCHIKVFLDGGLIELSPGKIMPPELAYSHPIVIADENNYYFPK